MKLNAVVKVGGSLLKRPKRLREFCKELEEVSRKLKILIVPGGGIFADTVRSVDVKLKLSSRTSHLMALMAMNQYGMILSDLMPNLKIKETLDEMEGSCIFLPFKEVKDDDNLPISWETTGDAIAARLAEKLGVKLLILVKDVDGMFDGKNRLIERIEASRLLKLTMPTCVDGVMPEIILRANITCYLVNGLTKNCIMKVFLGEMFPHTRIDPQ